MKLGKKKKIKKKMNPKVAIVILNYNTKDFLKDFLPSVCDTNYENKEIVVIDNHSKDDSVAFLKSNFKNIKVIELQENYGFTGGYNHGLKLVEADYYVLLNSDVKVDKDWLQPMVNLAISDKKIGAIQPKILDYNYQAKFEYAGACGGFIDKFGFPYCRGRIFETIEEDQGQYDDIKQIFWATGAAMFIKAELYHELGGLDEDFFAHMEEIDLCWRLQNKGYKIMVCPESKVYHVGGGTLKKTNPQKTYYNFRNGLILLIKNLPKNKLLPIIIARLILDHVAAYRWLFQGKKDDFFAVAKAHRHFVFRLKYWYKKRNTSKKNVYNSELVLHKSIAMEYYLRKKDNFSILK